MGPAWSQAPASRVLCSGADYLLDMCVVVTPLRRKGIQKRVPIPLGRKSFCGTRCWVAMMRR